MIRSLGKVTTASTTVGARATSNETVPEKNYPAQGACFEAIGTNTGTVLICDRADPNLTTGVGVLFEIPAPSASAATGTRPYWSFDTPGVPANYNLADIYILPTVSNEGVRVTANRN